MDQAELHSVVDRYFPGCGCALHRVSSGHICEVYRVDVSGRQFVLRVRPEVFCRRHVEADHSLLRYLSDCGFPAPSAVSTPAGDSCVPTPDGRLCELLDYLPHNSTLSAADAPPMWAAVASTLGRLHRLTRQYPRVIVKPDYVGRIPISPRSKYFSGPLDFGVPRYERGSDADTLATVRNLKTRLLDLHQVLPSLDRSPQVVNHNDFYPDNFLTAGDELVGVVDFDFCLTGSHLIDLTEGLHSVMIHSSRAASFWGLDPSRGIDWRAGAEFLRIYEEESGLTPTRSLLLSMLEVKVISLVFYPGFILTDSVSERLETLRRAETIAAELAGGSLS
ncbi:MAG: phosphotransferase [Bacillota bacterium]